MSRREPVLRKVPAVTRAVAVLQQLASAREPQGVVTLARSVGLIPSTCLHILRVLVDERLVAFNPNTKQYAIGSEVLSLSNAYASRNPLVLVAKHWLRDLSQKHKCAFAAVQLSGYSHCTVVEIGDAFAGLSVRVTVGTRFPALVSATGLCFAAFGEFGEDQLRRQFDGLPWEQPPSFESWLAQVAETRRSGYATDDGGYIRGAKIVAVPIFRADHCLLGSIAAVALREQLEGTRITELIDDMRAMEREINGLAGIDKNFRGAKARKRTTP